MADHLSPFLRLPTEIRLQIYGYLLIPQPRKQAERKPGVLGSRYHQYENATTEESDTANVLCMRIIDPKQPSASWVVDALPLFRRTKCLVRTDQFRARTMQTTYTAANNPGIHSNILATCTIIHTEAAQVLYTSYTFDFDTHVEAITAFLGDLTPLSKGYVRSVRLVKSATPYDREFDRCDWRAATAALGSLPSLRSLDLGVVAGKPGPNGWEGVPLWNKQDFEEMVRWRSWNGFEWVKELANVRLRDGGVVKVRSIVEHCPAPGSESMAFFVCVSRNVDGGFGDWVTRLIEDSS